MSCKKKFVLNMVNQKRFMGLTKGFLNGIFVVRFVGYAYRKGPAFFNGHLVAIIKLTTPSAVSKKQVRT